MKIDTDKRTLQQLADAIEVTEYDSVEDMLDNELRFVDTDDQSEHVFTPNDKPNVWSK